LRFDAKGPLAEKRTCLRNFIFEAFKDMQRSDVFLSEKGLTNCPCIVCLLQTLASDRNQSILMNAIFFEGLEKISRLPRSSKMALADIR
jgi:hypothetical protein